MLTKRYSTAVLTPKIRCPYRRRQTATRVRQINPSIKAARKRRSTRAISRLPATYEGKVIDGLGKDRVFAVVVARFNETVTKSLLEGALAGFAAFDIQDETLDVFWVPGSFELPVVSKQLAGSGRYAAVVCLGAVIRGGTSHYDAVVQGTTSGVLRSSMDTGIPVIFGVLTCDNNEQAMDRAGGKMGNKGYEAAITALEMAELMTKLP